MHGTGRLIILALLVALPQQVVPVNQVNSAHGAAFGVCCPSSICRSAWPQVALYGRGRPTRLLKLSRRMDGRIGHGLSVKGRGLVSVAMSDRRFLTDDGAIMRSIPGVSESKDIKMMEEAMIELQAETQTLPVSEFHRILKLCSSASRAGGGKLAVDTAFKVYEMMNEAGHQRGDFVFGTLMDACVNAGEVEEAKKVMRNVSCRSASPQPDSASSLCPLFPWYTSGGTCIYAVRAVLVHDNMLITLFVITACNKHVSLQQAQPCQTDTPDRTSALLHDIRMNVILCSDKHGSFSDLDLHICTGKEQAYPRRKWRRHVHGAHV